MSLSLLRDNITKKLGDRVDAASTRAINMRVNVDSHTDGYALVQADTLAEARTYAEAAKIVQEEYKRLTEAPKIEDAPQVAQKQKEKIYG